MIEYSKDFKYYRGRNALWKNTSVYQTTENWLYGHSWNKCFNNCGI